MKKRLGLLISAAIVSSLMMVPSFADVPKGVSVDLPDNWTMTDEMKIRSHGASTPVINYSYDIGRVQVSEDSTFESVYISYYVDSHLKDLQVPELKSKDAAMEYYDSINETIRKDIIMDCDLGHLLGEFEPIEMKGGEHAIYSAESDDAVNGLIIQPMEDGTLRVFNILGENDEVYDRLLAVALSYDDSNVVRHDAVAEIEASYENAAEIMKNGKDVSDKKSNFILIIIIGLIIIVVVFFTTRRNARKPEGMVFMEYDPKKDPDKVPVEVTCAMCGKKFIVFALESQVETTRKNTNRCPDCEAPVKNAMKISGRLTPWR